MLLPFYFVGPVYCFFNLIITYSLLLRKQSSVEIVIPGIFLGGLEKITVNEIKMTGPRRGIGAGDIRNYHVKF
jgi:hypothetical protein